MRFGTSLGFGGKQLAGLFPDKIHFGFVFGAPEFEVSALVK